MKNKKFEKEVKKQKAESVLFKNKPSDDGIIRVPNGDVSCCIPFMKCTRIGFALPKTLADGIRLECTNPDCPYVKHLVHLECFKSLESSLMSLIAKQGYNNSLSQKIRIPIEKLWEKNGLQLIQKNLRCACGKGQMKRNEEAWIERQAMVEPTVEKDGKKKHKSKTTTLPTLTVNVKPGLRAPPDSKKTRSLENHYLSSHSPPPSKTFIEDKYGPPQATIKAKTTPSAYRATSTLQQQSNVRKYPIGFAPVEPKAPKISEEPEDEEEDEEESQRTEDSEECDTTNIFVANSTAINGNESHAYPMPAPANAVKSSDNLFPHYHYSYNVNPNLKNALVQTDETSFSNAPITNPTLKMYSAKDSYEYFDSGNHSPKSLSHSSDSTTENYGNNEKNRFNAPPGYGSRSDDAGIPSSKTSTINGYYEEEELPKRITFIFKSDGSCGVAVLQNGVKKILKNSLGDDFTPLYLSMAEASAQIGEKARAHHARYPKFVIYDFLNIIGKPLNQIQKNPNWGFALSEHDGINHFEVETKKGLRLLPEEIVVAAFFKTLKKLAEEELNDQLDKIILSTNFDVTESQRKVFNYAALKMDLQIEYFDVTQNI